MASRRTREFLDGNKIRYTVISHSPAFTTQEVAAAAHVPGHRMAKTVMVDLDGVLAMAVVPSDQQVDMARLRVAADSVHATLAEEAEFSDRFEGCQIGAMPPLGNLFGMETYVDKQLAKEPTIAFNAGSHTEVIAMRFEDFRRLVHPKLAAITMSQEPSGSHARI